MKTVFASYQKISSSENGGATNSVTVYISALPGGNRNNNNGAFNNAGNNGNWWSATENSGTNAWKRNLNYNNAEANRNTNNKSNGFSVRCVRDLKMYFLQDFPSSVRTWKRLFT